jgi:hypothetical protein
MPIIKLKKSAKANICANAYTLSNKSILVDAACDCELTATIFTSVYTVVSGDIGNTINLSARAECSSGCVCLL